ncbi:hypothetical protein GGE08_000046 [Muricauda sp. ARW1Y1]|nr:hypothetical protein [Muricauda sp. ARW1Y1]
MTKEPTYLAYLFAEKLIPISVNRHHDITKYQIQNQ